jgi:hypothetical protein
LVLLDLDSSLLYSQMIFIPLTLESGASNSEEDTSFYRRRPFRRAIFGLSFFLILTCLCGGYLNFISNGAIVPAPVPMDVICTQYVNDLLGADLASTQALIQQAVAHSAQNNKTALASMAPYLFSSDFAIFVSGYADRRKGVYSSPLGQVLYRQFLSRNFLCCLEPKNTLMGALNLVCALRFTLHNTLGIISEIVIHLTIRMNSLVYNF